MTPLFDINFLALGVDHDEAWRLANGCHLKVGREPRLLCRSPRAGRAVGRRATGGGRIGSSSTRMPFPPVQYAVRTAESARRVVMSLRPGFARLHRRAWVKNPRQRASARNRRGGGLGTAGTPRGRSFQVLLDPLEDFLAAHHLAVRAVDAIDLRMLAGEVSRVSDGQLLAREFSRFSVPAVAVAREDRPVRHCRSLCD